jgi:hypothetical protein
LGENSLEHVATHPDVKVIARGKPEIHIGQGRFILIDSDGGRNRLGSMELLEGDTTMVPGLRFAAIAAMVARPNGISSRNAVCAPARTAGFLFGSYAAKRYNMPERAGPSDHVAHLTVGLLALWAWSNRKVGVQLLA